MTALQVQQEQTDLVVRKVPREERLAYAAHAQSLQ